MNKTLPQLIDELEKEGVSIAYAMRKAAESMYEYLSFHSEDTAIHDYLFKIK